MTREQKLLEWTGDWLMYLPRYSPPLLRKAKLADRMVDLLAWVPGDAWPDDHNRTASDYDLCKCLFCQVLADYRKITEGKK